MFTIKEEMAKWLVNEGKIASMQEAKYYSYDKVKKMYLDNITSKNQTIH